MKLYINTVERFDCKDDYSLRANRNDANVEIEVTDEEAEFIKRVYKEYKIAESIISDALDNRSTNIWHDEEVT